MRCQRATSMHNTSQNTLSSLRVSKAHHTFGMPHASPRCNHKRMELKVSSTQTPNSKQTINNNHGGSHRRQSPIALPLCHHITKQSSSRSSDWIHILWLTDMVCLTPSWEDQGISSINALPSRNLHTPSGLVLTVVADYSYRRGSLSHSDSKVSYPASPHQALQPQPLALRSLSLIMLPNHSNPSDPHSVEFKT